MTVSRRLKTGSLATREQLVDLIMTLRFAAPILDRKFKSRTFHRTYSEIAIACGVNEATVHSIVHSEIGIEWLKKNAHIGVYDLDEQLGKIEVLIHRGLSKPGASCDCLND